MTKAAGTPGHPTLRELASILPSIGVLVLASMAGCALGWATRRQLAAPIAAIVMFVVLLLGYTSFPESWLRIGGATGSLLALQPRTSIHVLQVGLYLSSGLALLEALRWKIEGQRLSWARLVVAGAPAVLMCIALSALGGMRFSDHSVATECVGEDVEVCTAPEYRFMQASIYETVREPFATLRDAGFDPPTRITQDLSEFGEPGTIVIGTALPDRDGVASYLSFSIIPPSCDIFRDPSTYQAYLDVDYWVRSLLGENGPDPSVSADVADGDTPASRARIRQIHDELTASCAQ